MGVVALHGSSKTGAPRRSTRVDIDLLLGDVNLPDVQMSFTDARQGFYGAQVATVRGVQLAARHFPKRHAGTHAL